MLESTNKVEQSDPVKPGLQTQIGPNTSRIHVPLTHDEHVSCWGVVVCGGLI